MAQNTLNTQKTSSLTRIQPKPSLENNSYSKLPYIELESINDTESIFERGHREANGFGVTKDVDKGWKKILEAAKLGHPVALALCFTAGVDTTRDDARAVELLKESSLRGHSVAQFNLGVCYIQGVGVDRNFSEAARYFKLASENEFPAAQFNLGNCYGSGIGVSRDYAMAAIYFKKASANGRQDAQSALSIALGRFADELKPEMLACRPCKPEAWEVDQEGSEVIKIERLFFGVGVERNETEARKLAFEIAMKRDPVAIAICLMEAIEFERTEKNGLVAFRILTTFKEVDAQAAFRLGLCYERGIGCPVNKVQAVDFFEKAAVDGHIVAMVRRAQAYELLGNQLNPFARELYTKASQKNSSEAFFQLSFHQNTDEERRNYLMLALKYGHPEAAKTLALASSASFSVALTVEAPESFEPMDDKYRSLIATCEATLKVSKFLCDEVLPQAQDFLKMFLEYRELQIRERFEGDLLDSRVEKKEALAKSSISLERVRALRNEINFFRKPISANEDFGIKVDDEEVEELLEFYRVWKAKADQVAREKVEVVNNYGKHLETFGASLKMTDVIGIHFTDEKRISQIFQAMLMTVRETQKETKSTLVELCNELELIRPKIERAYQKLLRKLEQAFNTLANFDFAYESFRKESFRAPVDYDYETLVAAFTALEQAEFENFALNNKKVPPFPSKKVRREANAKLRKTIDSKNEILVLWLEAMAQHPKYYSLPLISHELSFPHFDAKCSISKYQNVRHVSKTDEYTVYSAEGVILREYPLSKFAALKQGSSSLDPKLVRVFIDGTSLYVSMPPFALDTLKNWLETNQTPEEVAKIIRCILDASPNSQPFGLDDVFVSKNGVILGIPNPALNLMNEITKSLTEKKYPDWLLDICQNLGREDSRPLARRLLKNTTVSKSKVPSYWLDAQNRVCRVDVTAQMKERIQELMNNSSVWSKAGDLNPKKYRLGNEKTDTDIIVLGLKNELGNHCGYEVVRVERIENYHVWQRYQAMRTYLAAHVKKVSGLCPEAFLRADSFKKDSKTGYTIPKVQVECFADWQNEFGLLSEVNEVYGFHGCPLSAVSKIVEEGFDQRVSVAQLRDNRIAYGYFGCGIYVAENASKADEYSQADGFGTHVMFLARTCLGIPFIHDGDARVNPVQTVVPGKQNRLWALTRAPYIDELEKPGDSLIHLSARVTGSDETWPTKNSDFVVYDRSQIYPEFVITYKRKNKL